MGGNRRTLSIGELETSLSEVLERVRDGERYAIERDGEVIASLGPAIEQPGITLAEFVALLRDAPRPDDRFADDLEAIQASQGKVEFPEWPD